MSIKSLMRVYCDRCNPKKMDSGSGRHYQGVLTLPLYWGPGPLRELALKDNGWQQCGNEHWCPICLKEEKDEADAQNEAFRQSRGRPALGIHDAIECIIGGEWDEKPIPSGLKEEHDSVDDQSVDRGIPADGDCGCL